MVHQRRWLLLIFSLYIVLALGYSLLMPIWEAPDEPGHYHVAWRAAAKGEYPSEKQNYEARQPRLFYFLSSWVLRGLKEINPRWISYYVPKEYAHIIRVPERRFEWTDKNYRFLLGVYALRWMNILFGGIALWLNWRTFQRIVPEQPNLQLAALAVAALTPQYLHIMSSVNNDPLGTLAGALLFFLVVRFLQRPTSRSGLVLILLSILLPLSTKLSVLPVSAAVVLILAWTGLQAFSQKTWLLYAIVLLALGAGTFYLVFPQTAEFAWSEISWRLTFMRDDALTWKYIKTISSQILSTFWGRVGWLAVSLPVWLINALTAAGLIGMTLQVRRLIRSNSEDLHRKLWLATWLVAVFTILAVFRNGLTTIASQGRFLFPAMGALSLLMVTGWHDLVSERVRHYLPAFLILLFVGCTVWLWLTGVIPIYYQPFLD
jgi:hypothetical protein